MKQMMDFFITVMDLFLNKGTNCVGDPYVDPSCHEKDHMSHAKHRMDSAKGDAGNANTGGRGRGVKAFGHETVSRVPLLAVEKITRFHDPGAAAA